MTVSPTRSSDSMFLEVKNSFRGIAKWPNHQYGVATLLRPYSSYMFDTIFRAKNKILGR
jgi:hypothetical protein